MGIASGSLSMTRYRVLGKRKKHKLPELNQLLEEHKAKKIKLSGITQEEILGWVLPQASQIDMASRIGEHWDLSDCQLQDGFILCLRAESRRVNATLLQFLVREEIHKRNLKRKKPLSGKERKNLRHEMRTELLLQSLPNLQFIESFWNVDAGILTVFTTSKSTLQKFEGLFAKTFASPLELTLVKISPPLQIFSGDELIDTKGFEQNLKRVSSTNPAYSHL